MKHTIYQAYQIAHLQNSGYDLKLLGDVGRKV